MKTAREIYLEVAKKSMSSRMYTLHEKGITDGSIVLQAMELYAQQQVKKSVDLGGVISRMDKQHETLEKLYENMSNPNIVEPLKELLNRDGYKAGFMDGFRTAINYIKNGL